MRVCCHSLLVTSLRLLNTPAIAAALCLSLPFPMCFVSDSCLAVGSYVVGVSLSVK